MMGRKKRFKHNEISAALRRHNGLVTYAAEDLDCACSTVYDYIRRYPSVKVALQEAREHIIDRAERSLFAAIDDREPWAVALTLKTLGKHRGYIERQEITGQDGEAFQFTLAFDKPEMDNE